MSRIRTIKPEFWTSEQILELSPQARLLFIGLWNFCDDGGVHVASPRKLKAEVFPGDDVTLAQVQGWMDELIGQRLVAAFTANYQGETRQFWFVTGWTHQRIEKPYLKYPQYQAEKATPTIPQPVADHSPTIPQPVADHSPQGGECKGVEGKGEERRGVEEAQSAAPALDPAPPAPLAELLPAEPVPEPTHKASSPSTKPVKAVKRPIAADWQPAESTYALLETLGIDRPFAASCVPEFVLYWQERGESRPGWEASFVNSAKRSWEARPRSAPGGGRAPSPAVDRFDPHAKHARLVAANQAAVAEWLAQDESANPWGITVMPPPELTHAPH